VARRSTSLNSSALASAEYDDETQVLDVTFTSGQSYSFSGVPVEIYEGLASASSPGRYYHQNVKGVYG
jgi:hypothetical protein